MDVLVSPAPGEDRVWNLTDRLGRKVGHISHVAENRFVIIPAEIGPSAPLSKIEAVQPSLDAAMDQVEKCLRGTCQLVGERDRR